MKSLMLLLQKVLDDIESLCLTSTTLDLKTIQSRVDHEGLSFLTITLPGFGKDFEKSLDRGQVGPDVFTGFARRGQLPVLFGGLLDQVFDRSSGRLLEHVSIDAIACLRQVTLMFGKVALPCSDARVDAAIDKYVQCEQNVKESDKTFSGDRKESFERISTLLWSDVFTKVDASIFYEDIFPQHGPGATADKLLGNKKFYQQEWTTRLEQVFPHMRWLASSYTLALSELSAVNILEPGAERPVKVITVPKTLKTPRIIAVEPTCMQYVQQGILHAIEEAISEFDTPRNLISWVSQTPNQELAQKGSISGSLATLDLSEASDRVSNQHVRSLLRNHRHLLEAVDACRSRKADVPGHGVIRLAKFASMGSALCFPFEAMVFATVIFLGIEQKLNRHLTRSDIKSFHGKVRVYGDDIIIPVEFVNSVVNELEAFGFRVNTDKSFWTGMFRESCGKEYYLGHDVSLTRVRQLLPQRRKDVPEIISTVSLRNQLYLAGYWRTVKWLDSLLEGLIPFPAVLPTSPALGKTSFLGYSTERVDVNLQRPQVKGMVVATKLPTNKVDGYAALMKYFLKRGEMPFADREHLERSGRPVRVDIKHRWTYSY